MERMVHSFCNHDRTSREHCWRGRSIPTVACALWLLLRLASPGVAVEPTDPFGGKTKIQESTAEEKLDSDRGVEEENENLNNSNKLADGQNPQRATDEELLHDFSRSNYPSLELLAEIVRRGGPDFKAALQKRLEKMHAEMAKQPTDEARDLYPINDELMVFSAFQHLQKLPAPVPI